MSPQKSSALGAEMFAAIDHSPGASVTQHVSTAGFTIGHGITTIGRALA
jgi:hypothetical protein